MGRIKLNRMQFHTCHGALPHERHVAQEFWVDVALELPLARAGHSDTLSDTVNYGKIASLVRDIMMGKSVKLMETLALRIYDAIRALDSRIGWIEVRVTKVDPPIGVPSGGVEVVVENGE